VPIDEVTRMRADARAALDAIGTERLPDDPAVRTVHARVLELAHVLSMQGRGSHHDRDYRRVEAARGAQNLPERHRIAAK
jgi:hypothetical protein